MVRVLSEGCLLTAGFSVFEETAALASDNVVCFAGVSDGEGGVDELGALLAAELEDCGLAAASLANGVLAAAAGAVAAGIAAALPVNTFPGCCEYQKAPPAINKPAATPMNRPFLDFPDPSEDAEESSSNWPPKISDCIECELSADEFNPEDSACWVSEATGSVCAGDSCVIVEADDFVSLLFARGASHAGICTSSASNELGAGFCAIGVTFETCAGGAGATRFGARSASSKTLLAVSMVAGVFSEAGGTTGDDPCALELSENSMALNCSCSFAACCLSSSVDAALGCSCFSAFTGTADPGVAVRKSERSGIAGKGKGGAAGVVFTTFGSTGGAAIEDAGVAACACGTCGTTVGLGGAAGGPMDFGAAGLVCVSGFIAATGGTAGFAGATFCASGAAGLGAAGATAAGRGAVGAPTLGAAAVVGNRMPQNPAAASVNSSST